MKRRSVILLLVGGAALLVYVSGYLTLIERGWPGSVVVGSPSDPVEFPASYRVDSAAVAALFAPVHGVDRVVRKGYWSPTAEEAARQYQAR